MDASLTAGTILDRRYRILACIGEGGYGMVYKARDRHKLLRPGNLVAIKVITLATLSPQEQIEATDTFNREIALLSALSHRNLPRISDQFTDSEHWYIVMDYIDGLTPALQTASMTEVKSTLLDLHLPIPPFIFPDSHRAVFLE